MRADVRCTLDRYAGDIPLVRSDRGTTIAKIRIGVRATCAERQASFTGLPNQGEAKAAFHLSSQGMLCASITVSSVTELIKFPY